MQETFGVTAAEWRIDLSLWIRITLLYWHLGRRYIIACATELNCRSITAWSTLNIQYLQYMQVNALHYVISTPTPANTPRDSILANLPCSIQQSWFIKLLVGGQRTLIAAKKECVQYKRGNWFKGAHHCSSLIRAGRGQPAQTWDAARKICVCVCEEKDVRETARACFSHSHSRACERSALSANSTR